MFGARPHEWCDDAADCGASFVILGDVSTDEPARETIDFDVDCDTCSIKKASVVTSTYTINNVRAVTTHSSKAQWAPEGNSIKVQITRLLSAPTGHSPCAFPANVIDLEGTMMMTIRPVSSNS